MNTAVIKLKKWSFLTLFLLVNIFLVFMVSIISINPPPVGEAGDFLGFEVSFGYNALTTLQILVFTFIIQIGLLILIVRFAMISPYAVQIYPENQAEGKIREMADRVVKKALELAKKQKIRIRYILLYKKSIPNAFSVDLFPFRRGALIALNMNVLDVLAPIEVDAVLAHEIGHIKNRDSPLRLVVSIPRLLLNLTFTFLYLKLFVGVLTAVVIEYNLLTALIRTVALIIAFVGISLISNLVLSLLLTGNRQAELLADLNAAEMIGVLPTQNMLIRLGQRFEATSAFTEEISWLEKLSGKEKVDRAFLRTALSLFPRNEIDETIAREIAAEIFLKAKISELGSFYGVDITIDHDLEKKIRGAADQLKEKRRDFLEDSYELSYEERDEMTVDWRKFDKDGNLSLDNEELNELMAYLRENKDAVLFENELMRVPTYRNHPGFYARILLVDDYRQEMLAKEGK